jgi:hypothetical protein
MRTDVVAGMGAAVGASEALKHIFPERSRSGPLVWSEIGRRAIS